MNIKYVNNTDRLKKYFNVNLSQKIKYQRSIWILDIEAIWINDIWTY